MASPRRPAAIPAAQWRGLTTAQQRDVVRQSRQVSVAARKESAKSARANRPAAERRKLAQDRARRYAAKDRADRLKAWSRHPLPSRGAGPEDDDVMFWKAYSGLVK